jgi:hypothetical protein
VSPALSWRGGDECWFMALSLYVMTGTVRSAPHEKSKSDPNIGD